MKKTIYITPEIVTNKVTTKSTLIAGSLIVNTQTGPDLKPGGGGDPSQGLSKGDNLWNDEEDEEE